MDRDEIPKMDVVDTRQQEEIKALQNKDKDHDFWLRLFAVAIIGWLMIVTTVMMIRLTQMNLPKTDLSTTYPKK